MILVDTSIWVDHFRRRDAGLCDMLLRDYVAIHPFIIGELACGYLKNRAEIMALLSKLSMAPPVEHLEALSLVETYQLMGMGLGWIDVHLLASARVNHLRIWTRDRRLARGRLSDWGHWLSPEPWPHSGTRRESPYVSLL